MPSAPTKAHLSAQPPQVHARLELRHCDEALSEFGMGGTRLIWGAVRPGLTDSPTPRTARTR